MPVHNDPGQRPGVLWDPGQYLKFADHRLRPALELLERVPLKSPRVITDLGCGTGTVTQIMVDRWGNARVYGIDNSAAMLNIARQQPARIRWQQADIETWIPVDAPDLIYSNAALHWLADHRTLFSRLAGFINPGGCLAVQMPLNWEAPSHRLMRETLADGGRQGKPLGTPALRQAMARHGVEDTRVYYDMLAGIARHLDIWETEYLQVLDGEDAVLDWVRGTRLRPILDELNDADRNVFLDSYRCRLRDAYPVLPDGRTLYPFRRLFIVALL